MDALVNRYRCLSGCQVIDKNDSARAVLRILHGGEAIGILADQNTSLEEGVFVPFFGVPASSTAGLARIALRTDAAVVPGYAYWDEAARKYRLRVEPAIELIRTGDELADIRSNTAKLMRNRRFCPRATRSMDLGAQALEDAAAGRETHLSILSLGIEEIMARTAAELAKYLQAALEGDPSERVSSIANPDSAAPNDLIYVEHEKFRNRAQASKARCVIAPPGLPFTDKTVLRVSVPKLAFAKAAEWLLPSRRAPAGVHPSAVISASAKIAESVTIGPFVVVEDGVSIASGTQVGAFSFLGSGASVSEDCRLLPRVTLYPGARIGSRVTLHSGVVIGGDGFGYVFGEGKHGNFHRSVALKSATTSRSAAAPRSIGARWAPRRSAAASRSTISSRSVTTSRSAITASLRHR